MASCSSGHGQSLAFIGLLLLVWSLGLTTPAGAVEIAAPVIQTDRAIPAPVQERIATLVAETLAALLEPRGTLTLEALQADPGGFAEQVRTGLNWELEDRGYQLTHLTLGTTDPLTSAAAIDLVGAGVGHVSVTLAPGSFPRFWAERHQATLTELQPVLQAHYAPALIGLPIGPRNPDWARAQVATDLLAPPELERAFSDFTVTTDIVLGDTATVTVQLAPRGPVFEAFRVEARSDSLLMASLDSVEELLLAESNLVIGQPVALVTTERDALQAHFAALAETSETARDFKVTAPQTHLWFPDERPTEARAVVQLESTRYHLRSEAFIDLGNDEMPAELQSHAGYRFGNFETFVVLNVPTRDIALRPDFGLGLYTEEWFAGAAWDGAEGTLKYFAAWNPNPLFRFSAEIYAEKDEGQDQLGVLYQPTQQLGIGAFTDTDGLWWIRTSFRL